MRLGSLDDRVDRLAIGLSPDRLERACHVPNGARDVNERSSPVEEHRVETSHPRMLPPAWPGQRGVEACGIG